MDGNVKLQISNQKINPFGGINFIISEIKKKKIDELIDNQLGIRPKQAKYSYSDVILSWIYSNLCGAERLEDIQHIKTLFNIPGLKIPSSDRVSQIFRSLVTETEIFEGRKDIKHQFNIHRSLNDLMLDIILKLNLLEENRDYVLDYDNTVIACEKYDSNFTYLQFMGYQPGVCFINKIPIYIENRNGNSPAKYKMNETLTRCLELLGTKGIKINRFRSDSAAYQKKVFEFLDRNSNIEYFIRMQTSKCFKGRASVICQWEEIPNLEIEIGCKQLLVFGKKRRVVITRRKINKG